MIKDRIYFDYAAATPLDPIVLEAMAPFFSAEFYNPSATYLAARAVRKKVDIARADIAKVLGSRPAEIIFTSGATEANNLAISGIEGDILISSIEHESVLAPALAKKAKLIPVSPEGRVDLVWLAGNLSKASLVSIIYVNNEIGVVQPMGEIARIIQAENQRRIKAGQTRRLYLHTDATQAANYFDLHVSRLGIDMMSLNGGKIYGPKQTGVLYIKAGTELQPQLLGGGQEYGIRSGTENVPGIIGLAKALTITQEHRHEASNRINGLREELKAGIEKMYEKAQFNGSQKNIAPHILSVTFPGYDNERLMMELDEAGVLVAVGSACNASSDDPSHVLSAIGMSEPDIRSTLRFSLGKQTSAKEIKKALQVLSEIVIQQ
jgi:cysteine desulfurase